jgi:hypothetical protein
MEEGNDDEFLDLWGEMYLQKSEQSNAQVSIIKSV